MEAVSEDPLERRHQRTLVISTPNTSQADLGPGSTRPDQMLIVMSVCAFARAHLSPGQDCVAMLADFLLCVASPGYQSAEAKTAITEGSATVLTAVL